MSLNKKRKETPRTIIEDVMIERNRQDARWLGPTHDDRLDPLDWHEMIADYNGWARNRWAAKKYVEARERLIQVAALAVAAVEALDRECERLK